MLTGSSLYSDSWNTVYNLLSGNLTDPSARNKKWIFSSFPDTEKSNFPDFPIITINPISSISDEESFGLGIVEHELSTTVTVFTRNAQQLDTLGDNIRNAFVTNRAVLMGSGLSTLRIDTGTIDTEFYGNDRIHLKEFNVRIGRFYQ